MRARLPRRAMARMVRHWSLSNSNCSWSLSRRWGFTFTRSQLRPSIPPLRPWRLRPIVYRRVRNRTFRQRSCLSYLSKCNRFAKGMVCNETPPSQPPRPLLPCRRAHLTDYIAEGTIEPERTRVCWAGWMKKYREVRFDRSSDPKFYF